MVFAEKMFSPKKINKKTKLSLDKSLCLDYDITLLIFFM